MGHDSRRTRSISGYAFQLTNFLRDIAEDLRRGRVYLPQESLDQFGVDRDRLRRGRVDEPIRNLLAWEIERARGAVPPRPSPASSWCTRPRATACAPRSTLYSAILDEIEANDYDVFSRRVSVGLGAARRGRAQPVLRRAVARRAGRRHTPQPTA